MLVWYAICKLLQCSVIGNDENAHELRSETAAFEPVTHVAYPKFLAITAFVDMPTSKTLDGAYLALFRLRRIAQDRVLHNTR